MELALFLDHGHNGTTTAAVPRVLRPNYALLTPPLLLSNKLGYDIIDSDYVVMSVPPPFFKKYSNKANDAELLDG